ATQDELAASVIKNLARNGVEVETRLESAHRADIKRQEIKKQRALGLGGERDHLAALAGRGFIVDVLQVGGFAAQARAVIHDFAVDFAGGKVDEAHASHASNEQYLFLYHRSEAALWAGVPRITPP